MWPFKKRQLNSTSIENDKIKENELFEHKKYINELVKYQHSLEEEIATLEREVKKSLSEASIALNESITRIQAVMEEEEIIKEMLIKNEMDLLDRSTGLDFEIEIAKLLPFIGFSDISISKASGDQGIDIFAKKEGKTFGFQCKKYSSSVGNKAVQEVISGREFYNLEHAIVITNNVFTTSASELARKANVDLWNRMNIKQIISEHLIEKRVGSIYTTLIKEESSSDNWGLLNNSLIPSKTTSSYGKPQDDLFEDVKLLVIEMQTASVSLIQRRFRIGYNRAARLVDELEDQGVVGPSEGSKPRKVLIAPQPGDIPTFNE